MGKSIKKLAAKYGLPPEVVFCKRCVISNQRPSSTVEFKNTGKQKKETINFGQDGVCDACRFAECKDTKINWKERERELIELCDKYRRNDGSYDCIIPGSGGKDSGFVAHIMKYKYGMNPLTVTWSPHLYTDIGWRNMMSWIYIGGFDNILFSPNGRVHSLLTRLAFENLLHPFQPFIIGQKNIGPKMAVKYKVPLILYGDNPAEYGNKIEENDFPTMKTEFFASDVPATDLIFGGIPASCLIKDHKIALKDLNPYIPITNKEARQLGIEVHYIAYYLKWDCQENFYYSAKHNGFQANTERTEGTYSKYSSIDDKIDPFHYYTTLIKFGLGRATYDAAQEIRNKKITREEGVALVRRFDQEFPQKYFKEFLNYIGITEGRFWKLIDAGRLPHLWKKEKGQWQLRNIII